MLYPSLNVLNIIIKLLRGKGCETIQTKHCSLYSEIFINFMEHDMFCNLAAFSYIPVLLSVCLFVCLFVVVVVVILEPML